MPEQNIVDFCRPIFDKIVDLGTQADGDEPVDAEEARTAIVEMLDRLRLESHGQPKLGQQFVQVELPILFFIDFMMQNGIVAPGTWKELAFERNELAGDEKFFDLLEQTLGSPTDLSTERVGVFYLCLMLGFTGTYDADSPDLARIFRRCALRLALSPELVETGQLTPAAYENLDLVSTHRPINFTRWRRAVVIVIIGFIAVQIVNQYFFRAIVRPFSIMLEDITATTERVRYEMMFDSEPTPQGSDGKAETASGTDPSTTATDEKTPSSEEVGP